MGRVSGRSPSWECMDGSNALMHIVYCMSRSCEECIVRIYLQDVGVGVERMKHVKMVTKIHRKLDRKL